jgi:hypothetical protein
VKSAFGQNLGIDREAMLIDAGAYAPVLQNYFLHISHMFANDAQLSEEVADTVLQALTASAALPLSDLKVLQGLRSRKALVHRRHGNQPCGID